MKKTAIIVFVIVVIGLIWAYGSNNGEETPAILGVISPTSGTYGVMGEGIVRAITLDEAKNLEVIFEDDQCDTKKAVSAYNKLKLQNVKVFYVACSGSVLALAPLAEENGDLIVTAYAGSSEIRNTGDEVIRFNPDALSITDAIVDFANQSENKNKKFGLLHEKQDYSSSAADIIEERLGERIIVRESYVSTDATYRTNLLKFQNNEIDSIIYIPVSDKSAQTVYKEMSELAINKEIIGDVNLCDYPVRPEEFGLHGVCWKAELNNPEARDFEKNFEEKHGVASQYPFYDAETYDIVGIIDEFVGDENLNVPKLKKHLLGGVSGKVTSYNFTENGEVIGSKYLNLLEF